MTLPLLLIAYGSFALQAQQSLYRRVIPVTTGRNGYEEYVRAAEVLDNPTFDAYAGWQPNLPPQKIEDVPDMTPEHRAREQKKVDALNRIRAMNLLQIRREMTKQWGGALEIVRSGNRKPVSDPRSELNPETLFPELASFRRIGRLFVAEAYVRFSEGNPAAGTQSLLDCLTFSNLSSGGSLVSGLVSGSTSATAIAAFEDHLSRLSERDCRAIIAYVEANVTGLPPIAGGLAKEYAMTPGAVDYALKSPENYVGMSSGEETSKDLVAFAKEVRTASPMQRQAWRTRILDVAKGVYDRMLARLRGPEKDWENVRQDVDSASFSRETPVVRGFLEMSLPVFKQVYVGAARQRIQLRLLGLHGRVLQYKWIHGDLPNLLSDAVPSELIHDPLAGENFHYERLPGNGYRLYSKGSPSTGEIEIRYRRSNPIDKELRPPL